MFDLTDVSGKLELINNIMSTFDSFKSHLSGILESISKNPRFMLSDIQNEENKEQIENELGRN